MGQGGFVLRDWTRRIGTEGWDKEEFGTESGTMRIGTEGWDKKEWY